MADGGSTGVFDGIDVVTLVSNEVAPLLDLYVRQLGFRLCDEGELGDPARWRAAWGATGSGSLRGWLLDKPGSAGGALRLVEDRTVPPSRGPVTIADAGPHALDFYVRDMPELHERLRAGGSQFRSLPQHYRLFGTTFTVNECLLDSPTGLVHALVDYLSTQHRCVLSKSAQAEVSEVAAVVHVVPDIDEALRDMTDLLGATVYLNETFRGSEVERLMALPAGTSFRMALLRGPQRRNARLELIQQTSVPPGGRPPTVILGCGVPDLAALHARLSQRAQGSVSDLLSLTGPGAAARRFTWLPNWPVRFEFFERR